MFFLPQATAHVLTPFDYDRLAWKSAQKVAGAMSEYYAEPSNLEIRHDFTACFGLRSASYAPTRRSRSQSTQRRNRKGISKNKAFLCDLCELCGENVILMLVHHV
jgi:hypothetical protein